MFYLFYNLLSVFLLIPVALFNAYRSLRLGWPAAFAERFGLIPAGELAKTGIRPVIVLHAVSVGEIIAARPLLRALKERYPGHALVVSNTTETGRHTALAFPEIDLCIYFPFDFLPSVSLVLKDLCPEIIIIMETEIWPNFCREAYNRSIPLVLANGRISDRSFGRYLTFRRFFLPILNCFSAICVQSEISRDRLVEIGADYNRTRITGNLKNDIPFRSVSDDERQQLRNSYSLSAESRVVIAGSTRDNEERLVISAYLELLADFDDLLLILAPRHPARTEEVASLLTASGLRFTLRSSLSGERRPKNGEVLLVDTVGELMDLYALSDVAFVGGSLVPFGGHNLLEPASVGVPSIFGPHMENFREIEALVLKYGAGVQVQAAEELTETCRTLMKSDELRRVLGQNGLKMMRDNGGATARHLEVIAGYISEG
ncbi:MAG TPA: 3-deoxy-D-manno-octulosonic acid transferase [Desulfuromonadales bacterium]|nr:3-deoxy-D-manno-octulosonic acid transferase [Desulfuromonadales bacterium]